MFVVLLRFSSNKDQARHFMESHGEWLGNGFDDGVFVLAGSLQPNLGGCIMAHATSLSELRARVDADPFVAQGIVSAEIHEITPSRADQRLAFLSAEVDRA